MYERKDRIKKNTKREAERKGISKVTWALA